MTGHLASDLAFLPLPCGRGDGPPGLEPGWVYLCDWLSFQGPPSRMGIRLELGPRAKVGDSPCPLFYELRWGMAYYEPQTKVGLVAQGSLEMAHPKGQAEARKENNSKGPPPSLVLLLLAL